MVFLKSKFWFIFKRIPSIFFSLHSKSWLRKHTDGGKKCSLLKNFSVCHVFRDQKKAEIFVVKKSRKSRTKWNKSVSLMRGNEADEFCYIKKYFFEKKKFDIILEVIFLGNYEVFERFQ